MQRVYGPETAGTLFRVGRGTIEALFGFILQSRPLQSLRIAADMMVVTVAH
jgi:hypothetical protein